MDAGPIDVVVVYKVERLTRALADSAKIVERFDSRGAVSFASVIQVFNRTAIKGRLTLKVLLSSARIEREATLALALSKARAPAGAAGGRAGGEVNPIVPPRWVGPLRRRWFDFCEGWTRGGLS